MALLVRTFRTVVEMPNSTLSFLDWAWRWSAPPELMEPMATMWADDLFPPCSTKSLESCDAEDLTDSSGSEIDEDEWSSDEEWDSDSDDEWSGFSFEGDGHVEFWGDRWLWTLSSDDELAVQNEPEPSRYEATLVSYAMPSMELFSDSGIDSWIDKYGSSRTFFRVVRATPASDNGDVESPPSSTGIFVAVL